jgi:hypothetical protein
MRSGGAGVVGSAREREGWCENDQEDTTFDDFHSAIRCFGVLGGGLLHHHSLYNWCLYQDFGVGS